MVDFNTVITRQPGNSPPRQKFAPGDEIVAEDELGLTMYVIESGQVEISKRKPDGEIKVLAVFSKGDFFGEMCMLEEESRRTATAVAKDEVVVVEIEQSSFMRMLESTPEIAIRMMRTLVIRLSHTTRLLEKELGHKLGPTDFTRGPQGPPDPTVRLRELTEDRPFLLTDALENTIGRMDPVTCIQPDVDLSPVDKDRTVSRQHARIRREEDGAFSMIEDVGTANGTYVNGVRLTAGVPHPLGNGDSVLLATVRCMFEVDR